MVRKEIVGADNFNDSIRIFENRGNDSYDEILVIENETEGSNVFGEQFAVGDFDANGALELMVGDSEGELFIYESVGNNLLVEKWRMKLDIKNAHQLAAGDLTGDGIPEFVVGGTVRGGIFAFDAAALGISCIHRFSTCWHQPSNQGSGHLTLPINMVTGNHTI